MAAMADPILVEGFTDLARAFAQADRDIRLGFRGALRNAARPVAADASELALGRIPNMPRTPQWAGMRIGITQTEVYIVPRQKGTHGRGPRRRPNWANLMAERAMQPAADRNRDRVVREVEKLVDHAADRFNAS